MVESISIKYLPPPLKSRTPVGVPQFRGYDLTPTSDEVSDLRVLVNTRRSRERSERGEPGGAVSATNKPEDQTPKVYPLVAALPVWFRCVYLLLFV